MPEKQKPRDRKEIHTMLAAVAMTLIVAMWNAFANHDRQNVEAASLSALAPASITGNGINACITPASGTNVGARCITVTRTRSS